jgi:hypothetical protein
MGKAESAGKSASALLDLFLPPDSTSMNKEVTDKPISHVKTN